MVYNYCHKNDNVVSDKETRTRVGIVIKVSLTQDTRAQKVKLTKGLLHATLAEMHFNISFL